MEMKGFVKSFSGSRTMLEAEQPWILVPKARGSILSMAKSYHAFTRYVKCQVRREVIPEWSGIPV
jgi:hypothetical protein